MNATGNRKLVTSARLLLGLIFFVFGLNGFFHFLPQPPAPPRAMAFAGALFATGYFFPLLKATEVLAGALLLADVAVPLALVMLAPIIVNIVAFHAFLAPGNYVVVGLVLATELFLAWSHRAVFAPLFARRAGATTAAPARLQPLRDAA
ncbi:MAG TPA: DoxX family protein [Polyangia bacterium]|nr:DoxX family protein [Polyangia bacterium]